MADTQVLDSILMSVKKNVGIERDAEEFDEEIIIAINSCLGILNQLGVGKEGFAIKNANDLWTDFLGTTKRLEMVKNYVSLKVSMMFDPPQSSAVAEVKKTMISELEWRLNVAGEFIKEEDILNE